MLLNQNNTLTLLDNWEHFDPESTRAQRGLRASADHPHSDRLRREAEKLLLSLPHRIQLRLQQLIHSE